MILPSTKPAGDLPARIFPVLEQYRRYPPRIVYLPDPEPPANDVDKPAHPVPPHQGAPWALSTYPRKRDGYFEPWVDGCAGRRNVRIEPHWNLRANRCDDGCADPDCPDPWCIRAIEREIHSAHERARRHNTGVLMGEAWRHYLEISPDERERLTPKTRRRPSRARPEGRRPPRRVTQSLTPREAVQASEHVRLLPLRRWISRADVVQQFWVEILNPPNAVSDIYLRISRAWERAVKYVHNTNRNLSLYYVPQEEESNEQE